MNLKWIGSKDDITCKVGKWILRVEQMDEDFWWWRASYDLEAKGEGATSTKEKAMELAEETCKLNERHNELSR